MEVAMAQAKCITTAIRELLSRGQPPKSTNPVRLAHTEFVATLAGNVPHPISADVDSADLESHTDHLEKVFAALHVYLTAIKGDTAQNIPGGALDHRDLENSFRDLSADALGVIRNAAREMRPHETWRAS
jgi:hypothetical protein